MIRRGEADIMLVGASEAAIVPLAMAGLNAMTALSTRNEAPEKASRPFDQDRDGFLMAEGAAVLVLESLESAQARGPKILCEFSGYGTTDDAFHISAPAEDGAGAAQSMRLALQDASLRAEDIGYINAHGTSTRLNDKSETAAVKTVFGEAGLQRADFVDKVNDRPSSWVLRASLEAVRLHQGVERERAAGDDQLRDSRSGMRSGLCSQHAARRQPHARDVQLIRLRRAQRDPDPEPLRRHRCEICSGAARARARGPSEGRSMPYAHITGWGMAVPDTVLTNDELAQRVDTNDKWIRERTGIRERRIAQDREFPSTLAVDASVKALAVANLKPTDIDLIICATSSPEYIFPATACLIQDQLGASKAGCVRSLGRVHGFHLTRRTWQHRPFEAARSGMRLVIGAETLSRFVDWQDRNTCILFGDGAGAFVLQASE